MLKLNHQPEPDVSTSSASRPKQPIFTRNFILASLNNFFTAASITLLLATLPIYVVQIGGRQSEVGLVMGAFSIAALLVRPFSGMAIDVWGRKRFMVLGGIGMALSPFLYIITASPLPLIGVRLLQGMAFSITSTAVTALVADISPPLRRGEAVGYFGMSNNLSMAAGPALGVLIMASAGFTNLFIVTAGIGLTSLVFSLLVHEPQRSPGARPARRSPLIERTALFPTLVFYFFALVVGAVVTFLPLFAVQRGLGNPGLFFTVQAVVLIVARNWTGQLSDRVGRGAVAVPGLLLGTISIVLLSQASSPPMFLGAAVLYALAFAAVQPSLMALVIDRVKPDVRGTAMGTYMLAMDAGVGSGALLWGLVSDAWGYPRMYMVVSLMPLIGMGLFLWVSRRARKRGVGEVTHTSP
ncbi:MAG: MFS transporter [Chloroflexi bacterium]|nr:MFS transporter [Chloroflexota bacterium]